MIAMSFTFNLNNVKYIFNLLMWKCGICVCLCLTRVWSGWLTVTIYVINDDAYFIQDTEIHEIQDN